MNSVATYDSMWFFTIIEFRSFINQLRLFWDVQALSALHITTKGIAELGAKPMNILFCSQNTEEIDGTTLAFDVKQAAIRANSQIQNLERRSCMKKLLFAFLLGVTVVSSIVDLAVPVSAQEEDPKPKKPEGE
jgi:hypothetical protein